MTVCRRVVAPGPWPAGGTGIGWRVARPAAPACGTAVLRPGDAVFSQVSGEAIAGVRIAGAGVATPERTAGVAATPAEVICRANINIWRPAGRRSPLPVHAPAPPLPTPRCRPCPALPPGMHLSLLQPCRECGALSRIVITATVPAPEVIWPVHRHSSLARLGFRGTGNDSFLDAVPAWTRKEYDRKARAREASEHIPVLRVFWRFRSRRAPGLRSASARLLVLQDCRW